MAVPEDEEHDPLELFVRFAGALVSHVGGELIGHTPGAAFTAVSSVALGYAAQLDRKRASQADEMLAEAQQSTGITPDEMDSWARSEEHLHLLVELVEVPWRTRDREKVSVLSRVLADGITDDALIDVGILRAEALRVIEAPHLSLLGHMAQRSPDDNRVWRLEDLESELPRLAEGMGPLLATLQRAGCVLPASGFGGGISFVVTTFGREFLSFVRGGGHTLPS